MSEDEHFRRPTKRPRRSSENSGNSASIGSIPSSEGANSDTSDDIVLPTPRTTRTTRSRAAKRQRRMTIRELHSVYGATRQLMLQRACGDPVDTALLSDLLKAQGLADLARLVDTSTSDEQIDRVCNIVFNTYIIGEKAKHSSDAVVTSPRFMEMQADIAQRAEWAATAARALSEAPDGRDYGGVLTCEQMLGKGTYAVVWQMAFKDPTTSVFPIAVKDQFARASAIDRAPDIDEQVDDKERLIENRATFMVSGLVYRSICPHFIVVLNERINVADQQAITCSMQARHPTQHNLIALELCGGQLGDYLDERVMSDTMQFTVLYQVFFAMMHMHSLGMTHNDLYPRNILLNPVPASTCYDYTVTTIDPFAAVGMVTNRTAMTDDELMGQQHFRLNLGGLLVKIADFGFVNVEGWRSDKDDYGYFDAKKNGNTVRGFNTSIDFRTATVYDMGVVVYVAMPPYARDIASVLYGMCTTKSPSRAVRKWCEYGFSLLQRMCNRGMFYNMDHTPLWVATMFDPRLDSMRPPCYLNNANGGGEPPRGQFAFDDYGQHVQERTIMFGNALLQ